MRTCAQDQCEHVGHLVAFGNTEERLHRQILGCRARNQPAQPPAGGRLPPFDHKTGEDHVPFHGGDYHNARYNKRNQVVPLIVEALGDIGRRGARCLRFLARRASCRKRGRDGTAYSRFHPSNYLSHLAGIVTMAVFSDAAHIVAGIALLKTRTSGAKRAAAAADPTERARCARSPIPPDPAGFEPRIPSVPNSGRLAPCAVTCPSHLSRELAAARSPAPLHPAGFVPRIPCVPNSGLLCRVCLSPT